MCGKGFGQWGESLYTNSDSVSEFAVFFGRGNICMVSHNKGDLLETERAVSGLFQIDYWLNLAQLLAEGGTVIL